MKFSIKKIFALAALLSVGVAGTQTQAATCTYKVDSQWNTGFTASIIITNNGGSTISGWSNVSWRYNTNKITSSWNATITGANPYSARDVGWNGTIQPGQSVSFGFQGNTNGSVVERPAVTGGICSGVGTSTAKSSVKSVARSSVKSIAKSSVNNGSGFVARHGRLRTSNGRLVDQGGGPIQLRGMSTHGLQWYGQYANVSAVKWLRDDWKANVIRAAMYVKEGGYLDNASVINKVWETIDAAIAADIYVIVDWHILSDGNPLTNKEAAKDFFRKVTAKYGNNPHIIYEIANEPNGSDVTWSSAIKPYANEVIPVIRQGAPDAFVIVGTAVWSQRLDQVVASPLAFDKVAYSIHFYSCSAEHQDPLRAIVKAAADAKLPIFSTEWGNSEYTGAGAICPGQTDTWLNLLDQYGISWVNWSLSDKSETSAALKPGASATGGWPTSQLTDSGNYVRNRMRGY